MILRIVIICQLVNYIRFTTYILIFLRTTYYLIVCRRLGLVLVGEASIIVAVSSVHRKEALAATTFLMDTIKARVPIWKKEVYGDGKSLYFPFVWLPLELSCTLVLG